MPKRANARAGSVGAYAAQAGGPAALIGARAALGVRLKEGADVSSGKMVSHANRAVLMGQSGRYGDGRASRPWHAGAKTLLGRCADRLDCLCCHEDMGLP